MAELKKLKAELEKVKAELEKAKAELARRECLEETYSPDSVYGTLKQIGDTLYKTQNTKNSWKNTPLESINELKADHSGKLGELLIQEICSQAEIVNENTGDKNSKDGTYDQKIGASRRKVEIKTARLGGNKYQHETLKKDGYDYICFIDIHPDGGILTILEKFDVTKPHPITKTKPTRRKGSDDVYKWDFTGNHHKKFLDANVAIRFDRTTTMTQLADFIRSKII